jgi:hypothetical protein
MSCSFEDAIQFFFLARSLQLSIFASSTYSYAAVGNFQLILIRQQTPFQFSLPASFNSAALQRAH